MDSVPTSVAFTNDFLIYHEHYRIVICTFCCTGIYHPGLESHLVEKHPQLDLPRRRAIAAWAALLPRRLTDTFSLNTLPSTDQLRPPIPGFPIYRDGIRCRLCTGPSAYVSRNERTISAHFRIHHQWINPAQRGRPTRAQQQARAPLYETDIVCQQLFSGGGKQIYFTVNAQEPAAAEPSNAMVEATPEEIIRTQVHTRLVDLEQNYQPRGAPADPTEANPWLRQTGWPAYLSNRDWKELCYLIELPRSGEGVLLAMTASFDRIIEQARTSVLTERINIFDQTLINMFNEHQTKAGQPLSLRLQERTFKKYCVVWKKLLCFAYRIKNDDVLDLCQHRTQSQTNGLRRTITAAKKLQRIGNTAELVDELAAHRLRLDQILTQFCVSLFTHALKASLYQSMVISFLAVLAIDLENVCGASLMPLVPERPLEIGY